MTYHVSPHARFVRDDSCGVITDLRRGEYFSLNELGCEIWEGICSGADDSRLAAELAVRFSVSKDAVQHDVTSFIEVLQQEGLLARTTGSPQMASGGSLSTP